MATGTRKKTTQKKKSTGTTASKARKQREQQESFRNEVILWIALAIIIINFIVKNAALLFFQIDFMPLTHIS